MQPEDSLPCSQEPATGPYHGMSQVHTHARARARTHTHTNPISLRSCLMLSSHIFQRYLSAPFFQGFRLKYCINFSSLPFMLDALLIRLHSIILIKFRRNACMVLVWTPEGKSPLGIPRHRGEDNIKIDLREIGWSGMDWIHLALARDQRRALMNTVMNLRVP
jgi:hypothetical protein